MKTPSVVLGRQEPCVADVISLEGFGIFQPRDEVTEHSGVYVALGMVSITVFLA